MRNSYLPLGTCILLSDAQQCGPDRGWRRFGRFGCHRLNPLLGREAQASAWIRNRLNLLNEISSDILVFATTLGHYLIGEMLVLRPDRNDLLIRCDGWHRRFVSCISSAILFPIFSLALVLFYFTLVVVFTLFTNGVEISIPLRRVDVELYLERSYG